MKDAFDGEGIKVAVVGGGTGSFTLLSALKHHTSQIAAIVNMVDDGGSTGVLRDELGALPPGDVRQCLVALSETPKIRDLFSYRFDNGTFEGHSFGNLLLTALEKTTGSFHEAVETAGDILRINGTVIPVTYDNVRLKMSWPGDSSVTLHGERVIDAEHFKNDPRKATLTVVPNPVVNPAALEAIKQADIVIVAPGDLYTSLGPLLVTDGIGQALAQTKATVVYVCNLVTKEGQTSGFSVIDHASEIERFAGEKILDAVFYNDKRPSAEVLARYEAENAYLVEYNREQLDKQHFEAIGGDFLGAMVEADSTIMPMQVTRGLIRHNASAIIEEILKYYAKGRMPGVL